MTKLSLSISIVRDADRLWAARLMAASEPWIRLGRGYDECLKATQPSSGTQLFVARIEDTPCGFVLVRQHGVAGSPYIVSIAVEEERRGCGVGSQLIAHAEESSRPDERHMFLCVSSFNSSARRMYERCGYSAVGELPDYVIEGASEILMHKRLDRP